RRLRRRLGAQAAPRVHRRGRPAGHHRRGHEREVAHSPRSPRAAFRIAASIFRALLRRRLVKTRIVVLGAGFGGLELTASLSEALGDTVDVALIDRSDAFVFGYNKLDILFGRTTPDAVRIPYREIAKPGVRVLRETVSAIDVRAKK